MNPKVSCIVPVYNGSIWIDRCLNSILNQRYKNLEIIVVDDGSTDNSLEKCIQYQNAYPEVLVLSKPHGGLSVARNHGLDAACGDIIGFVDIDDCIEEDFITILLENLFNHSADISSCLCSSDFDLILGESKTKHEELCTIYPPFDYLAQAFRRHDISVRVTNKLYRKELFDEIRFPQGVLYEDVVITYLLCRKSKYTIHIELPLYIYCTNSTGITRSTLREKDFDLMRQWKIVLDMVTTDCLEMIPLTESRMMEGLRTLADKYLAHGGEAGIVSELKKMFRSHFVLICKSKEMGFGRKISMLLGIFSIKLYGKSIAVTRRGS
jgi:glycosyltransferase involved in cell wall biosynthesis